MIDTKQPLTCNRMVHLWSDKWEGPRPGIVMGAGAAGDTHATADVNVLLHGVKDAGLLAEARKGAAGNTLLSVRVCDIEPGDADVSACVASHGVECLLGGEGGAKVKVLGVWPARA